MTLNKKEAGTELYHIDITWKATKVRETVSVYAKNRLDASNFLILNGLYGKQHSIVLSTANLLK